MKSLKLRFNSLIVTSCLIAALPPSQAFAEGRNGREIYIDTCFVCHGKGTVSSSTWAINSLKGKYNQQSLEQRIRSGGATMPPIKHLTPSELTLVAQFVLNDLATTKDFTATHRNRSSGKAGDEYRPTISKSQFGNQSITEFGYTPTNNGLAKTLIQKENIKFLQRETHEELNQALKYMPLMTRETTGDRVIYFGSNAQAENTSGNGSIKAYNLDSKKLLWNTELPTKWRGKNLPKHLLYSTPVIDTDKNKLYAMTIGDGVNKYLNSLAIVDLKTGKIDNICPVSNSEYFEENNKSSDVWEDRIHCKTAPLLTEHNGKKKIFVGCSMRIEPLIYMYINESQRSGAILSFNADKNGSFESCDVDILPTSKLGDSGVYQSSGKIAALPDGDILAATGNGPVDIADGEIGCSIVRLKSDLTVATNPESTPLAHSLVGQGEHECWERNMEYTVGGVSVVDIDGTKIAAGVNKLGTIAFFNPDTFNTAGKDIVELRVGNNPVYGTPVGFPYRNGAIFISAFGGQEALQTEAIVESDDYFFNRQYDHYYTRMSASEKKHIEYCAGYLSNSSSNDVVRRFFSGKLRNDRVVTVEGSEQARQIVSNNSSIFGSRGTYYYPKNYFVPFKPEEILGYSIDSAKINAIINNNKELPLEQTSQLPLFYDVYDNRVNNQMVSYNNLHFLKLNSENYLTCPDLGQDLVPIYKAKRDIEPQGIVNYNSVIAYVVSKDLTVRTLWVKPMGEKSKLSRSHLMAMKPEGSDHGLVAIPIVNLENGVVPETVLLDTATGEEVYRIRNDSVTHFSMPLAFDEKFLVPTQSGIEVYSLPTEGQ